MLLLLENEQKINRSNTQLYTFIIQKGLYKDFQTLSVVANNLPGKINYNFVYWLIQLKLLITEIF